MTSGEQPCEVQVLFQGGSEGLVVSERLAVTPMGPNLYRMEQSSLWGGVSCYDVIETEPQSEGTVRFLRVLIPSGLKTVSWLLSRTEAESPALSALLDKVIDVGGHWERIFGGVLVLHLPPAEDDQIIDELNSFLNQPPHLSGWLT